MRPSFGNEVQRNPICHQTADPVITILVCERVRDRGSPYFIQRFRATGWGRAKLSYEGLVSLKEPFGRPPAR